VQASLKEHTNTTDKVAAATTLVQPGTGKIVAMGQSKPYGFGKNETQINYSVGVKMAGSNYGFPVGSTFKPFVAAAAIEQGIPATQAYSSPYDMQYPSPVSTCSGKNWVNTEGTPVENESETEKGPYELKEAMAKSVNTYFVQMISAIGLCPVMQMTDKLGVVQGSGDKLPEVPSISLGARGIAPLTMASAYAAFASRGTYCTPIAIESIKTSAGKNLAVPKSTCSRAMSEKTADTINTLLSGVIDSGTGAQAGLTSRDSAGKTGTTDSRKNAWFVGYTPDLAGAVWVGSASQQVSMVDIRIGGVYHEKVYGGQVPGPIWRDAMTGALDGVAPSSFTTVDIPDPKPTQPPTQDNKPGDNTDDQQNDGTDQTDVIGGLIGGTNTSAGGNNGGNSNSGGTGNSGGRSGGNWWQ
jgi:membrane peptidoglycan carboxypeptidase